MLMERQGADETTNPALGLGEVVGEKLQDLVAAHPVAHRQLVLGPHEVARAHGRVARNVAIDGIAHALFLEQRPLEGVARLEQRGRHARALDLVEHQMHRAVVGFLSRLGRTREGGEAERARAEQQRGPFARRQFGADVEGPRRRLARAAQFAAMAAFAIEAVEIALRIFAMPAAQRGFRPVDIVQRTIELVEKGPQGRV